MIRENSDAADDLSAPLGQAKPTTKPRFVLPLSAPLAIAGVLGCFIAVFVIWAIVANNPLGGEPIVVISATPPVGTPNPDANLSGMGHGPNRYDGPTGQPMQPNAAPNLQPNVQTKPVPGAQTVTIIDGSSGKKQEVEIPASQAGRTLMGEPRLLDASRHGSIPKIAADGARPAEVYARATMLPAEKKDLPRIAIVLSGLGIGSTATSEALAKLPGAITFAFSPYASDVERAVARARAEGHEVLLQIPMEPFDYPDNDPGPQTLLTTQLADQNLDRLHWIMSRFQGYVGVVNFMGGRFTASERSLTPILYEINKRGLIYVDDGTSPRSLAGQIAGANSVQFVKAEIVLDAVSTPGHIDRALTRLEAMARERGFVVGVATALPAVIDRVAQWAKGAEGRGLVLVPISVVAIKPKAS